MMDTPSGNLVSITARAVQGGAPLTIGAAVRETASSQEIEEAINMIAADLDRLSLDSVPIWSAETYPIEHQHPEDESSEIG